jgi:hypothetical protein
MRETRKVRHCSLGLGPASLKRISMFNEKQLAPKGDNLGY